jgi:hypothetical protein
MSRVQTNSNSTPPARGNQDVSCDREGTFKPGERCSQQFVQTHDLVLPPLIEGNHRHCRSTRYASFGVRVGVKNAFRQNADLDRNLDRRSLRWWLTAQPIPSGAHTLVERGSASLRESPDARSTCSMLGLCEDSSSLSPFRCTCWVSRYANTIAG